MNGKNYKLAKLEGINSNGDEIISLVDTLEIDIKAKTITSENVNVGESINTKTITSENVNVNNNIKTGSITSENVNVNNNIETKIINVTENVNSSKVTTDNLKSKSGSTIGSDNLNFTAPAGSEKEISFVMAENDAAHIKVGGTSNSGYLEIATKDDGSEPIYVKQYGSNSTRTATLLDDNGNTSFPGVVSAGGKTLATDESVNSLKEVVNSKANSLNPIINFTNYGNSVLSSGNGDGAEFDKYNIKLSSWYGIGFPTEVNGGSNNIVFNTRNGDMKTKGTLYVKTDKEVAVKDEAQPCNGQIKPEHGNEMNYYGSNTPYGWLNYRGGVNEMRIGTGANGSENDFGTLKAGTIYSHNKEVETKEHANAELAKKMNNGIIQTYAGKEVSFKTEGNQNNVLFNYRSEQSQPITRFEFHAGQADGTKADIVCRHIDCWNIDAASQLKFNGNEANIFLKNAKGEFPLIKFKADTVDPYGHGIVIGGGGCVVVGAGESADTVYSNPIVPSAGDENLRLASDESIYFYPGQQKGFSDKGTYINTNGEYMMNNKKVATEEQLNTKMDANAITFEFDSSTRTLNIKTK